jgi:predicted Zn-dependent protease
LEWQQGDFRRAISRLCAAVDRYPQSARLLTTVATFLCTSPDVSLRDPTRSLEYGRRALAIADSSRQPEILDAIAAAYAMQGEMTEAIVAIEKGIAMARAQHDIRREQALMRMLAEYQIRQESVQ